MKIIFAHVKRTANTGDKRSSPILYYRDFFRLFDAVEIDLFDLKNIAINPNDFVIIGGGGIINSGVKWNNLIEHAINQTGNVIFWGCGFNKKQTDFPEMDISRALLVGIRDYYNPFFRFVPCVSCKSRYFDLQYQVKREIGIVKHHSRPLALHKSFSGIEAISNDANIAEIIRFIGESECIISNSYHALYWASLLGKKTGRLDANNNTRFNLCQYQYQTIKTIDDVQQCRQ